ncbi:PREDICTED: platelet-activating factor acetylhydrolase IB subunit beta homolog [Diuraphis noxia]|uniref:platelet-activating factor acetylhydrolase IB subunit beta homolog n=1 Tax=Diuraphis noxia TaxID=143948 RepID=UPI0007639C9F|nr:PREDICTED: platelet-activating factor acetylhydrolase IB subunit beta homolog [Diuraphis noxia]XP_015371552.1 PREDICTED: platelet-activating factor acetylhydrolase IB subunit beta homolog [Diuraphis noxia]XP_015371553.1 PREDICTED: platelet-activating factor acetylhydrolase IB subunit beta homolog [Diuraphis noxia]XP_015371554.1 PREDICTED: platelet-activating factor acetylhydrolase IB subunit beta homolog [Diuraphis noxia]XP_015371556.1 PREDICTED: platelet-activating factor acetylhydrolase IB
MNPCVVPTIPYIGDKEWKMKHQRYVTEAKTQDPNVLLIGASIIEFIQCYPIWNDKFVPLKSLNFGISGDRTQNVLWRVKNDILDHIKPKVCILNVGSNNVDNTPVQISEGILAIVDEIRSKLPDCYIIIIGILPRGPNPNPLRILGTQVNEILSEKVKSIFKVELFTAHAHLLQLDGTLSQEDAPDYLHPSEIGYRKIFNPIFERLKEILDN